MVMTSTVLGIEEVDDGADTDEPVVTVVFQDVVSVEAVLVGEGQDSASKIEFRSYSTMCAERQYLPT